MMKAAVSFYYEHGIFVKKEDQVKLGIEKGEAAVVEFPVPGVFSFEVCRDLEEIELEQEAKMLLALFEGICDNHFSFLGRYGITERLESRARPPIALTEIYPELDVKLNTPFTMLYRKVEDVAIEVDMLSLGEKPSRSLKRKIKNATDELSGELRNFYEKADCVIGAGSYISGQTSKPLETSFGSGELDVGIESRIFEGQKMVVNPFVVYWVIDDHCEFRKRKTSWIFTDLNIFPTEDIFETPIETITAKCYIPSEEITAAGASKDLVEKILKEKLSVLKPFIVQSDFLLPFSCPSIALEVDATPKIPALQPTTYGYVPGVGTAIPKISELTKINVKFFDFPRFNRKHPVVLDTSAIDISRFPLSPHSSFFLAFIENRELIIPKVVMHELKTRLRTKDRPKVEKALLRFNKLWTWGFIKNIRFEGTFPELSRVNKKDIEDLRDCMILDVARNSNGVIFTNDKDLIKLAALMGIYTITFSGLEEDIITVVRENHLKFTLESAIKKVREYGIKERGEEYRAEDVRWMIEYLRQQNLLKQQKIGKREVLLYIGPTRKRHRG